jgi:hypothetical protein
MMPRQLRLWDANQSVATPRSDSICELIEKFLGWCRRHRAIATVAFYRTRLRKLCQTFGSRDLISRLLYRRSSRWVARLTQAIADALPES